MPADATHHTSLHRNTGHTTDSTATDVIISEWRCLGVMEVDRRICVWLQLPRPLLLLAALGIRTRAAGRGQPGWSLPRCQPAAPVQDLHPTDTHCTRKVSWKPTLSLTGVRSPPKALYGSDLGGDASP